MPVGLTDVISPTLFVTDATPLWAIGGSGGFISVPGSQKAQESESVMRQCGGRKLVGMPRFELGTP
jgi:hypothetical protein